MAAHANVRHRVSRCRAARRMRFIGTVGTRGRMQVTELSQVIEGGSNHRNVVVTLFLNESPFPYLRQIGRELDCLSWRADGRITRRQAEVDASPVGIISSQ